ncbi:MAG TPA: hypothetical protein VMY98_08840 [Anaerolineae bacterium]|nr:hypothetical protein [Anaerolineae bacterium]
MVSAETKEAEPTFDVVMPETHSFWSNVMISHNTTLAQHIVAEAQKLGGTAVYIDMEHAVDLAYMAACGVDTSAVYFSQPDSGTDALNIVRKLVSSNTVDLIVVDSVAALTSVAELDADAGDQFMGVQARMMSQNLRTIVPSLGLSKTALGQVSESASQRVSESALDGEWQTAEFDVEWGKGINREREHQEAAGRAPGTDGHDPGGSPGPGGG